MVISADGIIAKMKNQKINYDKVMRKMISEWERSETRPSILIHSCCAPCSTYMLELLTQYADVAIYFANPIFIRKVNMNVGRKFKKRLLNSLMSVQILMLNILKQPMNHINL